MAKKIQENYTFGCTTKRPDIEESGKLWFPDGKCKDITIFFVTIKECHCHDDAECILPLMEIPEDKPEEHTT